MSTNNFVVDGKAWLSQLEDGSLVNKQGYPVDANGKRIFTKDYDKEREDALNTIKVFKALDKDLNKGQDNFKLQCPGYKALPASHFDDYDDLATRSYNILKKDVAAPSESFWKGVSVASFMRNNGTKTYKDNGDCEDHMFRYLNATIMRKDEYTLQVVHEPKTESNPQGKPSVRVLVHTREGYKATVYVRRDKDMPNSFMEGAAQMRNGATFRVCIENCGKYVEVTGQLLGNSYDDDNRYVFHAKPYRNMDNKIQYPTIPLGGTYKEFESMEALDQWLDLLQNPDNFEDVEGVEITFDRDTLQYTLNSDYEETTWEYKKKGDKTVKVTTHEYSDQSPLRYGMISVVPHGVKITEYITQQFIEEDAAEQEALIAQAFAGK